MSSKPFDFLDEAVDFDFIEGAEGESLTKVLAEGDDFLRKLTEYAASTRQSFAPHPPYVARPKTRELPTRDEVRDRLVDALTGYVVVQMPEGFGKSSVVGMAAEAGRKVVFCSKTNDQLVEQEASFRARWPKLRIHRHISKGRNLQEVLLRELGVAFDLVYYEPHSPYSAAAVDEPSSRQALRKTLDEHGYQKIDHVALFDRLYTTYRAPRIIGKDVDIILCTLAAFQGMCTSKFKPWWHSLGLFSGFKRVYRESNETQSGWERAGEVPSDEQVQKKDEWHHKQRTAEIGIRNVLVVIDDPTRNDFDFRRIVEDERAVELHQQFSVVPQYQREWRYVQHWLDQKIPPLLARELAQKYATEAAAHAIEQTKDHYFEVRPLPQHIGYGLRRGYAPDDGAPSIAVFTTEHITAKLAMETLKKVAIKRKPRLITYMREGRVTSNYGPPVFLEIGTNRRGDREHVYRDYTQWLPLDLRPDRNAHVTLLNTKLVRRKNKALLLVVHARLREEFPDEDLTFIGDGLGLDLNLTTNRGRNDLAEKPTLIKLSVPHRDAAVHLWSQFPNSDKPRVLNTIMLADLANQAIGRNQGYRWQRKQAMVIVDPMYSGLLVRSGLLRYQLTPWSSNDPPPTPLQFHGPITELEKRLMYWLVPANAHRLGTTVEGWRLAVKLPENQRLIFEAWLDANTQADPGILKRWEARQ